MKIVVGLSGMSRKGFTAWHDLLMHSRAALYCASPRRKAKANFFKLVEIISIYLILLSFFSNGGCAALRSGMAASRVNER